MASPLRAAAPARTEPGRRQRQVETPRHPLRVVPDPAAARKRRRRRRATLATFTLACAGLFGVVGLHVRLAEGQAELDQLRAELDQVQEVNEVLRVDVAQATSPSSVLRAARDLGMVEPPTVVTLRPVPWEALSAAPAAPADPPPQP